MSDFAISLIRTYVPIVVGAVVAWLVARGIAIPSEAIVGTVAFLTAILQGFYYFVARLLEQRYPQFGWLLGQAKQLKYEEQ